MKTLFYALPFVLIFFCFWLPYKSGKKGSGIIMGIILLLITLWGLCAGDFLLAFALEAVIAISIVFITYWIFRYYKKKKMAAILALILSAFFLYLALTPWIDDWTFAGNDAKKILKERGFALNDEIILLSNESGGVRGYYLEFKITISDNDYERIKNQILSQRDYLNKKKNDFEAAHPGMEINKNDTAIDENENFYNWSVTPKDMDSANYLIQLDKYKNELSFEEND